MAQDASQDGLGWLNMIGVTRRFFFGLPIFAFTPRTVSLKAVAATEMPGRITIPAHSRGIYFEQRDYSSSEGLREIFIRHGIAPALQNGSQFLLPFDSLATRERFWREVGADPEW